MENQTEHGHLNSIHTNAEDKNVHQSIESDVKSGSKPNITFTITSGKEETIRDIRKLVSKYKSIKYEECEISENTVVENTIKMTSRGTAQDCHIDCQVTEGCLGWFLGSVG